MCCSFLLSHRSRLQSAYSRLVSLNARLAAHPQPSLRAYYLLQLLRVHKRLERPRDKEWIASVLSLMSGDVGRLKGEWEIAASGGKKEDKDKGELSEFVDGLRDAGASLEKGEPVFWSRADPFQ